MSSPPSVSSGKTTVLIVEDEVFIREYADFTIEDLGHATLTACDSDEALGHLRGACVIDALFVDIRLSEFAHGGYVIAKQAVELWPGLRVLYTSGSELNSEMSGQFVSGGRFLQKPYSPAQLETSMAELFTS